MKNNEIEILVLEYVTGSLGTDREKILRSKLIQHGYTSDELDELRRAYENLDNIPVPQASDKMTDDFYRMLASYKQSMENKRGLLNILIGWLREKHIQKLMIRAAYGLVLLFTGWMIGLLSGPKENYQERLDYMSAEISQMKEMIVLAELNQPSPSERIRAINQIKAYGTADERTIAMLFHTLRGDSNTNVRLVAIEALAAHAGRPGVRQELIHSISLQDSPLTQLALTDLMVGLNEKRATEQLRSLLLRKDLNDSVRAKIEDSIKILM